MQSINNAGEFSNVDQRASTKMQEVDFFSSNEKIIDMQTIVFTLKINIVKGGVTKDQLATVKDIVGLDYATLAYMLSVTDRTLYLKKGKETFSQTISDKFISILELYSVGHRVLGQKRFEKWMNRPNRALGGVAPIRLMNTQIGMEAVKEELVRGRRGIL